MRLQEDYSIATLDRYLEGPHVLGFAKSPQEKTGSNRNVNPTLSSYYRIPTDLFACTNSPTEFVSSARGFFRFGPNNICYGRSVTGVAAGVSDSVHFDALAHVRRNGKTIQVPFSFDEIIENLRFERYLHQAISVRPTLAGAKLVREFYYSIRDFLPVSVRRHLQRAYLRGWESIPFPSWPVDFTVDNLHEEFLRLVMEASGMERVPFIWFWPEGASSCLIMTHDVETSAGRDFTSRLMDLDDSYGIKASFQVIPEKRYEVPDRYVSEIRSRGFEFNIHDLNHDGALYRERDEFLRRAAKINQYVRQYNSSGFRAGAMYRNQDWYEVFEFSYDMSVPNVAHLEPMRGGCCTVMPYFIGKIIELPLTMTQDYSLFNILNDYSINLWRRQLSHVRRRNGLISFITHPDYLIDRRSRTAYESLLDYLRQAITRERIWAALPGDVNRWWRARSEMNLIRFGGGWSIEGPESDRARIAYASIEGDRIVYSVDGAA